MNAEKSPENNIAAAVNKEPDTKADVKADIKATTNEVGNLKIEDSPAKNSPPSPAATGPKTTFAANFKAFSKFGDSKSDGKHITLSQSDKWMKQAKVIDGKKITTTDTGIFFKKHKSMKLSFEQYKTFLEELTKSKNIDLEETKRKMANCGPPGVSSATGTAGKAASAVDRLTDVSKYTGSHKQRFDESGKGKGIAGRKDIPDQSGYVQGFKDSHKAH